MSEHKAVRALDGVLSSALVFDPVRRAPVGRALDKFPKHIRDDLKALRSEHLMEVRPDSIMMLGAKWTR